MSKSFALLLIPVLLISGLYITTGIMPGAIPKAHAVSQGITGLVCITRDGDTACPGTAPLLNSSLPPASLRLAVVVNGSAALVGFDISILTNHVYLKPFGVSTVGSVLGGNPATLAKCIGGTGLGCGSQDTIDTLRLAATTNGPTFAPTTGLLFTAIYNVTGAIDNLPIGFQTGCGTQTSVSGGVCVTIGSGQTVPDSETVQSAKFANKVYFDIQPVGPSSLIVPAGNFTTAMTLSVTSINNFAGTVSLTAAVTPTGSSIPAVTISPTSVKVNITSPGNTQQFASVNVTVASAVPPGLYILNFTGSSPALPPGAPPNTLLIRLTVPPPDFSIALNPVRVSFNVTASGTSQVILKSVYNFAGRVNLTIQTPPTIGAQLAKTSLNVTKAGTVSTTVTLNGTLPGSFNLNITGTSVTGTPSPVSHPVTLQITVLDFVMVADPGLLLINQGTVGQRIVTFGSFNNQPYNLTVGVTRIFINQIIAGSPVGPSTGISVGCSPVSGMIIKSTGLSEGSNSTKCLITGTQVGNYTVTVIGVSGTVRPVTHAVTFPLQVLGPDFTITANPTVLTVDVGRSSTLSLSLAQQLGLNSNVTLRAEFGVQYPNPPTATVNVQILPINSTFPTGTAVVTVSTSSSAPTGVYTMLITATATRGSITHLLNIIVVVTSTTSSHDLGVLVTAVNPTSVTVGSNVSITIQVKNLGKASETSTVIALAQDLSVAQQNVTLLPGTNINVTLTWNTNGWTQGSYIIGAKVLKVSGETNLDNNVNRYATPVSLTVANTSPFTSSYFAPSIIIAVIAIAAILGYIFLQARRKTKTPQTTP